MLVSFRADLSNLSSGISKAKEEIGSVGTKAEEASGKMRGLLSDTVAQAAGAVAFAGLSNAVGVLKNQLSDAFQQSLDAQAGMAQTVKVLQSTHDVSGMTAQAVADLSTQYSHLTKFSDDTVQSAENMLLTFTNIGKNVFPQATKTVLDMSQALGQDTKSSAIQLGKALNDPLTGITALSRVGVTFDTQQKNLIKTYMAHNDIAKAQGIILKELQREFGGSAEAAGKTFGGQMAILNQRLDDVRQNIGDALMPVVTKFMGFLADTAVPTIGNLIDKTLPLIQSFSDWVQKSGVLSEITRTLSHDLQATGNFLENDLLPPLLALYNATEPIITDFIAWNDKTHFLQNTLSDAGDLIRRVAFDVADNLLPPLRSLIANIEDWTTKSNIVHDSLSLLGGVIDKGSQLLGTFIGWISALVGWFDESKPRADALKDVLFAIGGIIATMKVVEFGKNVFNMGIQAKDAAGHFLELAGNVKDKLGGAFDWVKGKVIDAFNTLSGKTKSAEGDVATASKDMEGDLAGVGTQAKTTGAQTATIGTKAEVAQAEVATASAEMDTELAGVGTKAEVSAGEVAGIGPAMKTAEGEVATASTGMAGSLSLVSAGITGIIALEGILLQNAIPALISSYSGGSQNPTGDSDIQRRLDRYKRVYGHEMGATNLPAGVPYVAGEHGKPELIYPAGSTNVYTAPQTAAMLAGATNVGQGDVYVQVVVGGEELTNVVAKKMDAHVRAKRGPYARTV